MARLTPRFSCNRMAREYTDNYYIPAAMSYRRRAADNASLSDEMEKWFISLTKHWHQVRFGQCTVQEFSTRYLFQVEVLLGELSPATVRVELYAEPLSTDANPICLTMDRGEKLAGPDVGYQYHATVPMGRPAIDYTPRVIPYHVDASVPLEANFILWRD